MGGAGRIPSKAAWDFVGEWGGDERDFEKVLLIERILYPALAEAWKAAKDAEAQQ